MDNPIVINRKILTQPEMASMFPSFNYHLQHGMLMKIPIDQIDGLDPEPADWGDDEGTYHDFTAGKEVTKPIEVWYEEDQDKFILYDGNHRVKQAKVNNDKYILALVQTKSRNIYNKFINMSENNVHNIIKIRKLINEEIVEYLKENSEFKVGKDLTLEFGKGIMYKGRVVIPHNKLPHGMGSRDIHRPEDESVWGYDNHEYIFGFYHDGTIIDVYRKPNSKYQNLDSIPRVINNKILTQSEMTSMFPSFNHMINEGILMYIPINKITELDSEPKNWLDGNYIGKKGKNPIEVTYDEYSDNYSLQIGNYRVNQAKLNNENLILALVEAESKKIYDSFIFMSDGIT